MANALQPFAGLFGLDSVEVEASATASVSADVHTVLAGMSPFAVPEQLVPEPGEELVFYPGDPVSYDEGLGVDKVAPGCWGLVDLTGEGVDTTDLYDQVANGYPDPVELDVEDGYT